MALTVAQAEGVTPRSLHAVRHAWDLSAEPLSDSTVDLGVGDAGVVVDQVQEQNGL